MKSSELVKVLKDRIIITLDTIDNERLKIQFINEKIKFIDNLVKKYLLFEGRTLENTKITKETNINLRNKILFSRLLSKSKGILNNRLKTIREKPFDARLIWLGNQKQLDILKDRLIEFKFISKEDGKNLLRNFILKKDIKTISKNLNLNVDIIDTLMTDRIEISWLTIKSHLGYLLDELCTPDPEKYTDLKNVKVKPLISKIKIWKKTSRIFIDDENKPMIIDSKNAKQAKPTGVERDKLDKMIVEIYTNNV